MTHSASAGFIAALVLLAAAPASAQLGPVVAVPGAAPQARAGALTLAPLAKLDNPFGLAVLPDGGVLVTEKTGKLQLYKDGTLSAPIAGVPKVVFRGQGGLLDVVLHPRFAENRILYLSFTESSDAQPGGADPCDTRLGPFCEKADNVVKGLAVLRARLDGDRLADATVIWRAAPKTMGRNHFGGRMAFAADGMLLVTVGDRQRFDPAQDKAVDLGKIVRLTADGAPAPGNPFAALGGAGRDVWSLGHRNPTGIVAAPDGRVWVGEMGPMGGDEINLIEQAKNYGWPLVSEGDNYDATPLPRPATRPDLERAKTFWNPSVSPSGLMLYTGAAIPAWRGSLLAGGLSSEAIIRVVPAADGVHDIELIPVGFRVRALAEAPDGALYVLKDGDDGALLRLTVSSARQPGAAR
jgi:glucose/arabinose dehydrogenase